MFRKNIICFNLYFSLLGEIMLWYDIYLERYYTSPKTVKLFPNCQKKTFPFILPPALCPLPSKPTKPLKVLKDFVENLFLNRKYKQF